MRLFFLILFSLLPSCVFASEVNETPDDDLETQQDTKPSTGSAERFVMPVKTWLEDKAHKSSVLNPASEKRQGTKVSKSKSSLRAAISAAQKIHPGTVLSAKSVSDDNDNLVFKVKILSSSGVIKEVEVPSAQIGEQVQP